MLTHGEDLFANALIVIIGVVMCLWGLQVARFIASIALGGTLGYIAFVYTLALSHSIALAAIAMLIVLVLGLALGFAFFKIGIAIVFGFFLSKVMLAMLGIANTLLLALITLVLAALLYVIASYIASLAFAVTGSVLVFRGLVALGMPTLPTLILAVAIGGIGFLNQVKHEKRVER